MKYTKRFLSAALMVTAVLSLTVSAHAADYSFTTDAPADYYPSSAYEDVYGSQYNYGGPNVVDYQIPELEFGVLSTTQTGIMERARLPGLQDEVATVTGGGYGIGSGVTEIADIPGLDDFPVITQPAYTSTEGMERLDGSIGTLKIPALGINMKVWEGETSASMRKGLGHYSSTSAWDGNVALCGHNRGARYVIVSPISRSLILEIRSPIPLFMAPVLMPSPWSKQSPAQTGATSSQRRTTASPSRPVWRTTRRNGSVSKPSKSAEPLASQRLSGRCSVVLFWRCRDLK